MTAAFVGGDHGDEIPARCIGVRSPCKFRRVDDRVMSLSLLYARAYNRAPLECGV